jgi:hypothetical protein
LGLVGNQDLFVLRNVVMNPFSTEKNFMNQLADTFRKVLEEEVENVRNRNAPKPVIHDFVMQGTDKFFFVHRPNYFKESDRYQFIFSADLPQDAIEAVKTAKAADPKQNLLLKNKTPEQLEDIAKGKTFDATIVKVDGTPVVDTVTISTLKTLKKRSLDLEDLDTSYPQNYMPFYLYGSLSEVNIDHLLTLSPNIQLCAYGIQLKTDTPLTDADLSQGLIAFATNIREASMQPFPKTEQLPEGDKFFFHPGKVMDLLIYRDPFPTDTEDAVNLDKVKDLVTKGTLTLGDNLYVDSGSLNDDGQPSVVTFDVHGAGTKMPADRKQRWIDIVQHKLTDKQPLPGDSQTAPVSSGSGLGIDLKVGRVDLGFGVRF